MSEGDMARDRGKLLAKTPHVTRVLLHLKIAQNLINNNCLWDRYQLHFGIRPRKAFRVATYCCFWIDDFRHCLYIFTLSPIFSAHKSQANNGWMQLKSKIFNAITFLVAYKLRPLLYGEYLFRAEGSFPRPSSPSLVNLSERLYEKKIGPLQLPEPTALAPALIV